MRFFIAFILLFLTSTSNATEISSLEVKEKVVVSFDFNNDRKKGKRARHGKRMNKKRKRACAKWGKRSFAG